MEQATAASPLPPAREIPSTVVSSVKSWWAAGEKDSAFSEERLLRNLPFYQSSSWPQRDPTSPIVATSSRVVLSNTKRYINTFSMLPSSNSSSTIDAATSSKSPPAIILHGYGAGLGFFFRNFSSLGQWVASSGSAVYALDWLGMGRSARPKFVVRARRNDVDGRVNEAESFFVDSLEEWRERMGLEKMTLIGHSLGAYLTVAYALRHPSRVNKLVLLSPAGVPRDPDAELPAKEVTADQADLTHHESSNEGEAIQTASKDKVQQMKNDNAKEKRRESTTARLFTYMWEEGWSPFQAVRNLSIFGPMIVGKYSARRFSGLTEEETRNMNDYILNITLAKGSGEYCISHLLAPFAHARRPLVDRVSAITVPVTFVYGDQDWMDPEGGKEAVEKLKDAGNRRAKMYIIRNAGHHVHLDNPPAVNELLLKELTRN